MRLNVQKPSKIMIGYVGENFSQEVIFNYGAWANIYGEGTLTLALKRFGDSTAYPVFLSHDSEKHEATWNITTADVAKNGKGEAQLSYTVNSVIKKSSIFPIKVDRSIEQGETPPEPLQEWFDEVIEAGTQAVASATQAKESADNAKESEEKAKEYAESTYTKEELDELLSEKASASDLEELEEEVTDYRQMYLDSLIHTTASGSIASFNDGADGLPMKSCVAQIVPKQDLHGQSNPYPAGGGKNLLPMTAYEGVAYNPSEGAVFNTTPKPIQPTDNGDGTFTITFTSSWKYYCFVVPLANGQTYVYKIQYASTGQAGSTIGYLDADMKVLTKVNATDASKTLNATATGTDERKYLYLCISNRGTATATITITNPQVELGSTATAYAPYENICPISGWTGTDVVRSGKNLFPPIVEGTFRGITATVNDDGSVTLNGTANGSAPFRPSAKFVLKAGRYILSGNTDFPNTAIFLNGISGSTDTGNGVTITLTEDTEIDPVVQVYSGKTVNTTIYPMIRLASEDSTYEPYKADTYSVTWESEAGTVYGGSVDLVSGSLTVTHGYIASYNGETLPSTWISDRDVYAEGTTPTIGAEVVYELAQPTTYQLTPQEIKTLLGNNNVWADTGSMSCGYVANTKLYIDSKLS